MLKKTITYTNYNNVEVTEDCYFNFTKAELTELETSKQGGLAESMNRIIKSVNVPEMVSIFKEIILKSYGEKSDDGKYFLKSEERSTLFSQTEAFSILFMELINDPNKAGDFIVGIMPADMQKEITENIKNQNGSEINGN